MTLNKAVAYFIFVGCDVCQSNAIDGMGMIAHREGQRRPELGVLNSNDYSITIDLLRWKEGKNIRGIAFIAYI